MIKANELRIGNIARVANLTGRVIDLHSNPDEIYLEFSPEYDYSPEMVDPIPITPEWLVKFGFEKHELGFTLDAFCIGRHAHIEIAMSMNEGSYYMSLHYYTHDIAYLPLPIEHVHQLQNTIFVITGIELESTQ